MPLCCIMENDALRNTEVPLIWCRMLDCRNQGQHQEEEEEDARIPESAIPYSKVKRRRNGAVIPVETITGNIHSDTTVTKTNWFVALLSRVQSCDDSEGTERTSIRLTKCVTDMFNLQHQHPHEESNSRGWNLVLIIGPTETVEEAADLSQKLASSPKGIAAKVARGEALSKVLGIPGYVDLAKVFPGYSAIYKDPSVVDNARGNII
jgi:hypothetical protein